MMRPQPRVRAGLVDAAVALVNVVAAFYVTQYLFNLNSRGLFGLGWDQQAHQTFLGTFHRLADTATGVGMESINGMGNIALPFLPSWFPSYFLAAGPQGFIADWALSFAIAATMLFATTFACARIHGLGPGLAAAAAWLLTFATWPVYTPPKIIALWLYTPQPADALCVAMLMSSAALLMKEGGVARLAMLSVAIFGGISAFVIARPTFLVLIVPMVAAAAVAGLVFAPGRRVRLAVAGCWVAILAACLVAGYLHHVAGLLAYTAAGQFPDLGKRLPTLYSGEATILLWSPVHSFRGFLDEPARVFVACGIVGSLAMVIWGTARQRAFGVALFGLEALLVAIGVSNFYLNYWFGPAIWYFENFLLPFFAIGCAFLLGLPWRFVLFVRNLVAKLLARSPHASRSTGAGTIAWGVSVALAITLPAVAGLHAKKVAKREKAASDAYVGYDLGSPIPQPDSDLTRILKAEARLVPGQPFRGRVATMLGRMFPEERYWGRYSLVHYFAQFGTGNLHDGPGLWQDDIPTVFEYNYQMTPAYLAFVRRLLTEPQEIVIRNLIGTRRFDARVLRMMGARFVLTDAELPSGARLRKAIDVPVPGSLKQRLEMDKYPFESVRLFLYELDGANFGQYSPVQVRVAPTAAEMLRHLSDPSVAFESTVILAESPGKALVPARLERFEIGKDRYVVKAASDGPSLLLLPVEFSRCLRVHESRGGPPPRLVRANLLFTGVLFDRQVDAELRFRAGPFGDSSCRLEDLADTRAMQMKDAFRDRPEYGRLGWQDYWNKK